MKIHRKNLLYSLSAIRQSAFTFLEAAMTDAGITDLSPAHGDILYVIHKLEEAYVKEIVARSHRDKSTVSNIINQLVKKGFVEKRGAPDDGRRVRVRLSEKARIHMESMALISKRLEKKLFSNMSEEEQAILFLLLEKVKKEIEK